VEGMPQDIAAMRKEAKWDGGESTFPTHMSWIRVGFGMCCMHSERTVERSVERGGAFSGFLEARRSGVRLQCMITTSFGLFSNFGIFKCTLWCY